MKVFKEFYENGVINKGLKNAFITLIPKGEGPTELSHFRPICLVGCVYKLLAKVLAGRLKEALPEIIGDSQGAFLKNRQILDVVLIGNELVHIRIKDRKLGLLFKVDMEKAYDFVEWFFARYLFDMMGFVVRGRGG